MSLHLYESDLGTFLLTHDCCFYVNSTTLISFILQLTLTVTGHCWLHRVSG